MLSQHTVLANKYKSIFRAPQINSACFKILFLFIMQAFCDMNNMHPYLRITVSKSNFRTRSNPLIPTRFAICGPSRPRSKTLRPTVPFFFGNRPGPPAPGPPVRTYLRLRPAGAPAGLQHPHMTHPPGSPITAHCGAGSVSNGPTGPGVPSRLAAADRPGFPRGDYAPGPHAEAE